jgi:hypothetical protein
MPLKVGDIIPGVLLVQETQKKPGSRLFEVTVHSFYVSICFVFSKMLLFNC